MMSKYGLMSLFVEGNWLCLMRCAASAGDTGLLIVEGRSTPMSVRCVASTGDQQRAGFDRGLPPLFNDAR